MTTTNKTSLWGKIAVTALGVLALAAALGYVLSLLFDWFVIPGCVAVWGLLFQERSLMSVLRELLEMDSSGLAAFMWLRGSGEAVYWIIASLERVFVNLWAIASAVGHLLIVTPCLILPIHAWALSKKRWGSMAVAASFLLSGAGFLIVFLCLCETTLRGCANTVLSFMAYGYWDSVLHNLLAAVLNAFLSELPVLFMALGMLLLAFLAFLGMRPRVVSVLGVGFSACSLGVAGVWWIKSFCEMLISYAQLFEYGTDILQIAYLNIANNVGATAVTFSSFALYTGVLLTALVFVISTRMPALIGKKES